MFAPFVLFAHHKIVSLVRSVVFRFPFIVKHVEKWSLTQKIKLKKKSRYFTHFSPPSTAMLEEDQRPGSKIKQPILYYIS